MMTIHDRLLPQKMACPRHASSLHAPAPATKRKRK